MTVRVIREADVQGLVTIDDALQAVELAFQEQARGTGINEPRRRVYQPHGILHLMGGALVERGYWGFKAYTTTRQGARFLVHLYEGRTGALLAILEADLLGRLRTGAASGVATRYLAREDARTLALFGAGHQAQMQLLAIARARPLEEVRVYCRTPERRLAFAEQMAAQVEAPLVPVATPTEALEGADIVTTITNAATPVFSGDYLAPGMHINAAGSNAALRTELDRQAVQRADRIFTDDLMQAQLECGDLIQAQARNALAWSRVRPLADVVAGLTTGRVTPQEITLFESQGIAIWDIALAATIYERALENGVGELIDLAGG